MEQTLIAQGLVCVTVGPQDVWPIPNQPGRMRLVESPWMDGNLKPARDGKYLRHWLGSNDKAFSFFRGGVWYASEFWDSKSDAQDIPWAGGVRTKSKAAVDCAWVF